MNELAKIPYLGAGIGLRIDLAEDTFAHNAEIETVEIIAESYFANRNSRLSALLDEAKERYPVIPHGVDLSIGSSLPVEAWYMEEAKKLIERLGAHYYSDHFALTRSGDELDIGHLSPIWFSRSVLENVIKKVATVQNYIGKPLVLENITAPFTIPHAEYREPEFISEVCRRTGCGMLLDVTNVFINAHNFKQNAAEILTQYPLDSVVQIHMAGGVMEDEQLHDTHSAEITGINEGVWPLFEWAVQQCPHLKAVIIERDNDFGPDFEKMILKDLRRIKSIWSTHAPHAFA